MRRLNRGMRRLAMTLVLLLAGCSGVPPSSPALPNPPNRPTSPDRAAQGRVAGQLASPSAPSLSSLTPSASPASSAAAAQPSPWSTAAGASPPPPARTAAVPGLAHVYLIVMENREYGSIVGNPNARFINKLIREGGLATNDHAVTHPSEPNYLALFAGSTFGIRDDGIHNLRGTSLADQLTGHELSWHVYEQDYPGRCSTVSAARGPKDLVGPGGWYVRKHDPAISFVDIARDPARCAEITHLAGFDPAAASFELIVPNLTNDMHDGTIAQGDAFLRAFVPRITSSPAFADGLLLITWDEGTSSRGGGGHVATIALSPRITPGARMGASVSHYSILRTVEEALGVPCLRHACGAGDLGALFAP